MIFKVFAFLTIVSMSTTIGYKITEKKRFRRNVYSEIVSFCENIKTDVGFTDNYIDRYIDSLPFYMKALLNYNEKKLERGERIIVKDVRFSTEEQSEIEDFFNRLGNFAPEGFVNMINHYQKKFESRELSCVEVYKKTSVFYLKISALIGVLVFVIVV